MTRDLQTLHQEHTESVQVKRNKINTIQFAGTFFISVTESSSTSRSIRYRRQPLCGYPDARRRKSSFSNLKEIFEICFDLEEDNH